MVRGGVLTPRATVEGLWFRLVWVGFVSIFTNFKYIIVDDKVEEILICQLLIR